MADTPETLPPEDAPKANSAAEATVLDPVCELEKLQTELKDAQDRYLRSQAELENTRKRFRREMDDERKYAFMPLLKDLVPVLDNIERAIEAAKKTPDPAKILEGVQMVATQLEEALGRHACTRIKADGELFDPNFHQAILQQPAADKPENTVLLVTQAGFQLHDRVVRPAQVIVSKKPE